MRALDEERLLEKLNAGSYRAFTVLYERYWEEIFLYIQRIIHNENDAKDLVQDVFMVIWNLKEKLQYVHSLKAYSLTIAKHKAFRYLRDQRHKTEWIEDLASWLTDNEPDAVQQLIGKELAMFIADEVEKLPARMQETYKKSRNEGLSNKEIALLMEVSDETVKKQIKYSLKHLRLGLSKFHGLLTFFCFIMNYK